MNNVLRNNGSMSYCHKWCCIIFFLCVLFLEIPFVSAGNRIVKVGVYENPPKIFNAPSGRPSGLFIDIIEHIAEQEGWRLKYVTGTWSEGLNRLEKGEIDLMPDVAYSSGREKIFSFHKVPVLSSYFQVYAHKGSGIKSILDLNGKHIAVLDRSVQQEAFKRLAEGFQLDFTLISLPDYQTIFERVAKNQADAAITNRFYGMTHAEKAGLEDTAVIFHPSNLFFAAPEKAPGILLDRIDAHLTRLKKDPKSMYYTGLKRWVSEEVKYKAPIWLQAFILAACVVILASLISSIVLKRQVNARTVELYNRSRFLHILSECNQALVRTNNEDELLDAACSIAVDSGGYRLAWIGLAETDSAKNIRPVSMDSSKEGPPPVNITELYSEPARTAITKAFQTGMPFTARHISTDPSLAPWQDQALAYGYAAVMVLPLIADAEKLGVLCIYAAEANAFEEKEASKLTEFADDLSFGIASHRSRMAFREADAQRREAQQQLMATMETLRASEKKYRELVTLANSIILRWACDGRISFLNEFGQRFFGYTEQEVLGRNVVGTIVPENESTGRDLSSLMKEILADTEAFEHNVNENMRRDGKRVWIDWTNKVVLDEQGQIKEVLSIGTDITLRKQAEEQIHRLNDELRQHAEFLEQRVAERTAELSVAKEQAESADRIKSAFLATMSHELRTPLNSIIGFTGILRQGLAGPLNEEQNKQMGMVQTSSRHLLALINDVLDISKIEAGQLALLDTSFELKPSIEKMVDIVSPLAEKKGINLNLEFGDGIEKVTADQRRLEQVILNLLNNALKFTEQGRVDVCCRTDHDHYILSVSDTGIGIQPEEIAGLFQPFHQIDTGLTRKHEGTGLGLSICKKLMDMMGGAISVRSQWGQGSTFTIRFPHHPRPRGEQ